MPNTSNTIYTLAPSFTGPIQPSTILFWLSRCSSIFQSYNELHPNDQLSPRAQIRQAGLALLYPETCRWWDAHTEDLQSLTSWNDFATRFKERFLLNNSPDMAMRAERSFYTFHQDNLSMKEYVGELEERRAILNECNRKSMVDDVQYKRHLLFGADQRVGRDVEKILLIQGLDIDAISVEKLTGMLCEAWEGPLAVPSQPSTDETLHHETASTSTLPVDQPTSEEPSLEPTLPLLRPPSTSAHNSPDPPDLTPPCSPTVPEPPVNTHVAPTMTTQHSHGSGTRMTPAPLTAEERRSIAAAGGCFKCRRVPTSIDWVDHKAPTCPGDPSRGIPPGPRYVSASGTTTKSRHKRKSSSVTTIAVAPAPQVPTITIPAVDPQWYEEQANSRRSGANSAEEVDYDTDYILSM